MGKDRREASSIELYIVVCNDFHLSTGPFNTAEVALEVAKRLNKKSHCVFVPVPFVLQGDVVNIDEIHSKKKSGEYHDMSGGGYL